MSSINYQNVLQMTEIFEHKQKYADEMDRFEIVHAMVNCSVKP